MVRLWSGTAPSSIPALKEFLGSIAGHCESPEKTDEQDENASGVQFNMETKRKPGKHENVDDGVGGIHTDPFTLRVLGIIGPPELDA